MFNYDVFDTVREAVDFITDFKRLGWDASMEQDAQVKGYIRALRHAAYANVNGMAQGYLILTSLGGVCTASGCMVADGMMGLFANGVSLRHMYRVTVYDDDAFPYSVRDLME